MSLSSAPIFLKPNVRDHISKEYLVIGIILNVINYVPYLMMDFSYC